MMKRLSLRFLALGFALTTARAARGQEEKPSPIVIGQMVDAVLRALVSPDSSLSRVPVSKRQIAFDKARTLESFGYSRAEASSDVDLRLRATVVDGSRSMLSDCKQSAPLPCAGLGWRAYVWVERISITASEATLRVWVAWADRGDTRFAQDAPLGARAFLVGFGSTVHLEKDSAGTWRFSSVESTAVG